MWINALRLREVGKFSTGYTLEGLSPGLNVLIGPNELGKSTLLRSLRVLFEYSHTSNHAAVRALRPYSGGAPQIECEFHLANQHWLLRKQYLASRSAELRSLSGGSLYRGGDVDRALSDLVEEAAGSLATLKSQWVVQGDGFRPPRAAAETVSTVQQLVAEEVSSATGGDQLDMIVGKVSDQLSTLITAKSRKPKAGGPLHVAQRELSEISAICEELREKARISSQRQARFDEIFAVIGDAGQVAELERLKAEILERRAQVEADQHRLNQCELAAERRKRQAVELDTAQAAYASYIDRVRIYSETSERLGHVGDLLEELGKAQTQDQQNLTNNAATLSEQEAYRDTLRRQALIREQQRRYEGLVERLNDVRRRHANVQEASEKVVRIDAALAEISLTQEEYDKALSLKVQAERISIELEAQSATIEVDYLPDRNGTFIVDGKELGEAAVIQIDRPLIVEVPGIGRLRIAPGLSKEMSQLRESFEEKQDALAAILAKHSFDDVEQLEQAWQEKSGLLVERTQLANNLQQIAPEGAKRLTELLGQLEQQVEEAKPDPAMLAAEVVEDGADLNERIEASTLAVKTLQADIARRDERRKQLSEEQSALSEALSNKSVAEISDFARREARVAQLQNEVREATDRLNLAVRQEHALFDGAPSQTEIADRVRELEQLDATVRSRQDRLASLNEEAKILEGALRRDAEDGLGVQVHEAEEQKRAAAAKVDALLLDVAALDLLEQRLSVIASDRQRLITRPVMKRVARLAAPLFDEAAFGFGDGLELKSIDRQGIEEPLDAVSDGTREQIGVLARLAFSDILADGGHPLPLVLDDPFVFADDARLESLFQVLKSMSAKHQLLILTCHERAFSPLIEDFGADRVQVAEAA